VVATNTETGTKYETVSTETGNYTLAQLPAGVYQLSVELPGFKKYVRQGITVLVAQTLRLDVALAVGATTDEVTITADAPLLRTHPIRAHPVFRLRAKPVWTPFRRSRFKPATMLLNTARWAAAFSISR